MKAITSTAQRELRAAQLRAKKAWTVLERRREQKLAEVLEVEKELHAMHPILVSLFSKQNAA